MLLHKDEGALEEAIRATANSLSLPVEYVEKDYWVTFALKTLALSNIGDEIVFKGGTSLSKAYNLISRFSEDIDIAVLTDGLNGNQVKTKLKKTTKLIDTIYEEIESPDTSKGSKFRKMRFQYPRIDSSTPVEGQITDSLLLEVNAFADPEPYKKIGMLSYVAEYFLKSGFENAVKEYELEEFEMNVLCTSRTLCEKI
ncbi:nucleotidyl transferase AbiEii/AbiGii toxin family protein, partial [Vibrio sp. 1-Bac 57]